MVTLCLCLLAASDQLGYTNHQGSHSPPSKEEKPVTTENSQAGAHQEHTSDSEQHLQTLTPIQQYSPLHIPQFPGSMNMGYQQPLPLTQGSAAGTPTCALSGSLKVRGASDCPGICPLCGATLRQARNLRRHLLSSCKCRFSSHPLQGSLSDSMMIEVKPEVDVTEYSEQSANHGTDSGNSERIICKPSPLPSPVSRESNVVSPRSNAPSPTIAR